MFYEDIQFARTSVAPVEFEPTPLVFLVGAITTRPPTPPL